jgi:hypothetical protein
MKEKLISIYGWYGVFAITGAYMLVSFSIIEASGFIFQILNATGALGIVIEAYYKKDYAAAVLNIIWIVVAISSITLLFLK